MAAAAETDTAIRQPPTTFLGRFRHIGPSLVLTATLVGSGELVLVTVFGAQAGFCALWLILCTCFLKVAIQQVLGRYTISSGDTGLEAINRLPGPKLQAAWPVWVWLICVLLGAIQLGGIALVVGECIDLAVDASDVEAGTESQSDPAAQPEDATSGKVSSNGAVRSWGSRQWAPLVCLVCFLMLLSGHYQVVERISVLLVSIFSISIIVSAVLIQWTPYAVSVDQILDGLTFQLPQAGEISEGGLGLALAIVAIVGLSPTELVYYPYWCLEKGYARFTGPNEGTAEWERRARGWIRVMQLDCYFAMGIYTSTTVAFYLLGAAVLHARGEVPAENAIVATLSAMYTETLGAWAYWIFIGSAFLVLFSTLFVSIASYARLLPDCLRLLGVIRSTGEAARLRWIRVFLVIVTLLFAATSQLKAPPVLLIVTGVTPLGLLLPIMCFAGIYLRYFRLDRRLIPSSLLDLWLWASAVLTIVLTVYAFVKPLLKE